MEALNELCLYNPVKTINYQIIQNQRRRRDSNDQKAVRGIAKKKKKKPLLLDYDTTSLPKHQ